MVHNITNFVVMNTTANALLALGASPVMAHALEEVEEMVRHARALVLNIGTWSPAWADAMLLAGREARKRAIPIVLDPAGAGATSARTQLALELLEQVRPSVLRCNASEVRALAFAEANAKGVDSTANAATSVKAARTLVARFGCVVSVSGEVDVIVGDEVTGRVWNGHPLMTRVTGMGCTASALTGAFAAVDRSAFDAALAAMAVNGVAGEIAAERCAGPGSFQLDFLDALHNLDAEQVDARARVEAS